jgi:hypothetical protein
MMTRGQLRYSFKVYAEEVGRCKKSGCYWSLLHLVMFLPEVCAALEVESPEGKGQRTDERYKAWCRKYVATEDFNEEEWWDACRTVLHQKGAPTEPPGRYSGFVFSPPGGPGHKLADPVSKKLRLDVWSLADQMLAAMERWFDALLEDPETLACVEKKIPELVWVELPPPEAPRSSATSSS